MNNTHPCVDKVKKCSPRLTLFLLVYYQTHTSTRERGLKLFEVTKVRNYVLLIWAMSATDERRCWFTSLPTDLVHQILDRFLSVKSIGRLDSSLCSGATREDDDVTVKKKSLSVGMLNGIVLVI